jgi:hypothetical protein
MNVATLYEQTALLGFEDSIENISAFYHAANRAIYQINLLRPHTAEYRIFRRTATNLLKCGDCTYTREDDLTFEAEGARAYAFQACGYGTLFIERYDEGRWTLISERTLESEDFAPYRGFIKAGSEFIDGRVRLRFAAHSSGDYTYYVRGTAMYKTLFSGKEEDIQIPGEYTEYDISRICPDFISFAAPPILTATGERIGKSYEIYGGKRLLLAPEATGEYRILYHCAPRMLENEGDPDADTTEIDLDEELASLMPLLTAAYVWIEDEPEKAAHYMDLYRERAAEIREKPRAHAPSKIINRSGW